MGSRRSDDFVIVGLNYICYISFFGTIFVVQPDILLEVVITIIFACKNIAVSSTTLNSLSCSPNETKHFTILFYATATYFAYIFSAIVNGLGAVKSRQWCHFGKYTRSDASTQTVRAVKLLNSWGISIPRFFSCLSNPLITLILTFLTKSYLIYLLTYVFTAIAICTRVGTWP